ncbi:hypothetical protein Tco_0687551 [Tanacetum coccineum]
MGDENPIRTLGDYSKPSHEGYRNTIELPVGNNVDPSHSWREGSYYSITCSFLSTGKDAKLRYIDILMFQQHHGESLSKHGTRFHGLTQFEIGTGRGGGKLRNKNTDESWEIIKNLAFYDHKGWDETKEFYKPVKAISTPQGISKTPDRIHPNSHPQNQNEPPKLNTFAFREHTSPSPQPQALGTTFEARVRDYMAAHTKRMERFENTIFKEHEEINSRMTEMFRLFKELTTSRTPKKVLIREEIKFPVTMNVNSISLTRNEEEENNKTDETPDNTNMPTETEMPVRKAEAMNGAENGAGNESIITPENDKAVEVSGSPPVATVIEEKGKEYKVLPGGPVYDTILKKKITKKEDIIGNFEIPYSIGDLKHVNALVDQGSDVNVMPYSTYMRLTAERPAETYIRLSLASHSYIYPLGIAEDVLVDVAFETFILP